MIMRISQLAHGIGIHVHAYQYSMQLFNTDKVCVQCLSVHVQLPAKTFNGKNFYNYET